MAVWLRIHLTRLRNFVLTKIEHANFIQHLSDVLQSNCIIYQLFSDSESNVAGLDRSSIILATSDLRFAFLGVIVKSTQMQPIISTQSSGGAGASRRYEVEPLDGFQ
ncbi:hypothetical protein GCM10010840_11280 [Deinococcus aerolatus]|uniref:Uncharacterized protein n=1 Tax=Deinococcus aerolatus TaxID=522487 RepID=A0ABQ2G4Y1_9DEIO|nr:hypothetical protein GCM10010840_11280 [Deinococcus aerolatus]